MKETVNGSRSRSRSRGKDKKHCFDTDSIARGLSPTDLQRGENLALNRHSSTISTDLFNKNDEHDDYGAGNLEDMLFDNPKKENGISLRRFDSVTKDEDSTDIQKIFNEAGLNRVGKF